MSNKLSVLVMGATGNQGGAVVRHLLPKGHQIRTLTRNPNSPKAKQLQEQGVEVIKGDFFDANSLISAAKGMDTVYAMTTPFEVGVDREVEQGIALVDAIKQAKVRHLVFGSVASADQQTGIPHFDSKYEVEKYIATLNIPYTISAPVAFMDNLLSPWFLPSLKEGTLKMGMPADRPLQQVSVNNIGAFAASLIERREKVFGQRFDFAGDELSGTETMKAVNKVSGLNLGYEGFNPEMMRADNADFAEMFSWFNRVGYDVDIQKLHREFKEVQWQSFETWAGEQDWSVI